MDAFSGYNQILMNEDDQEKTLFVTSQGSYCYKVMPFGLKNVGVTYQRLVNRLFSHQIGRNAEVYMDDLLVKIKDEANHLDDLSSYGAQTRPVDSLAQKYHYYFFIRKWYPNL